MDPDRPEQDTGPSGAPVEPGASAEPGPATGATGPGGRPIPDVASPGTALPSVGARVLAFALILLAGAAGGFIGYSFVDLQCEGDCSTPNGLGALVGAVIGAVGVAVVTVLALRAMGEWRARGPKPGDPERGRSRTTKPPRVR